MNMSQINELRALVTKITVEMSKIEKYREEINNPTYAQSDYSVLLNAKASALNGIAVLVAASKR